MLNWREIPFFRLLLPLMVGISFATNENAISFAPRYAIFFLSAGILGLLLLHLSSSKKGQKSNFGNRWYFGALLSGLLFAMGYVTTVDYNIKNRANFFIPTKSESNFKTHVLIGKVTSEPLEREKLRLELTLQQAGTTADSLKAAAGKVICYIELDEKSEQLYYGDVLVIDASVQDIAPPKNPFAFDYQRYLFFQNIHYQCFVKENQWRRLAQNTGNPILMAALRGRQTCIKILDKHLNSDNERSVGAALILGFKDEIPQEVLTAYINTGSMHVLSVSGLHVGVVAIMLELLLKKISTRRRWWRVTKPIVLIFFIWVFSIFTGASAAVLRAAVMFSFLILGRSLRREVNIYNILAISAFVLLCYNPFLLMDVGFQLSYMALVGIVYFQPKIYRMWLIDNKLGDYLWSLTATGIAATLATLPISLYFFHQFPTYFWLSGFVVVPAAVVILWLGIALFCFDWIPFVGIIIGKLLYYGIWITNALLFLIQKLPYSVVTGIFISMAALIFLYLALLSTSLAILTKRFRWVLVGLGCLVPVLGMRAYQAFRSVESKKIIIYNTYKNSIIDCISSGSCRSFQSSGLLPKTELFATQNARWEAGVSNGSIEKFIFTDSLIERNDLLYKNNFISFCDKKIYFLNAPLIADSSRKINIDYLVVSKNSMLQIKEIKKYFDASLVILDASNTAYKAKKLAAECQLIGQPCWDMSEQPAFVTYCK